jgi:pimeloyl-ACP methyl ester carboxylesterase
VTQVRSRLIPVRVPRRPEAAVLVLHGGADRSQDGEGMMVTPTQLSVLRMVPIARRVAIAGGSRLAVYRVLNSVRGWNQRSTPVDDARWAMGQVRAALGEQIPFGLVGHSLGGRAALLAAGEPGVRSVVALAPWVYPSDRPAAVTGRRFLIVHGTADSVAKPERARAVARALAEWAAEEPDTAVSYVEVDGGKHSMLRHNRLFEGNAPRYPAAPLPGRPPRGFVAGPLAGEAWLQV